MICIVLRLERVQGKGGRVTRGCINEKGAIVGGPLKGAIVGGLLKGAIVGGPLKGAIVGEPLKGAKVGGPLKAILNPSLFLA